MKTTITMHELTNSNGLVIQTVMEPKIISMMMMTMMAFLMSKILILTMLQLRHPIQKLVICLKHPEHGLSMNTELIPAALTMLHTRQHAFQQQVQVSALWVLQELLHFQQLLMVIQIRMESLTSLILITIMMEHRTVQIMMMTMMESSICLTQMTITMESQMFVSTLIPMEMD